MAKSKGNANNSQKRNRAERLGLGDYVVPNSELAASKAQMLFVKALDIEAPQVRDALKRLAGMGKGRRLDFGIDAWAREFRLLHNGRPPRWVRQIARTTLHYLSEMPNASGWCYSATDWTPLSNQDCNISIQTSWDPFSECEEDARTRIVAGLQNQLIAIKRRAEAAGGRRIPKKRELQHFGWLVRYVVHGDTPESISASGRPHRVAASSVKQALRETAELLPLTLPEFPMTGKRGRPRCKSLPLKPLPH